MSVEAQLCPQCGAAVQFGAGQTEIVCSHCGTTVVKAAAPAAASVEKELEAEQLVQDTVRREKGLHAHGRPATAKIVTAQATDIFRPTVEGRAVLMSFAVEVQPDGDGQAAFAAQASVLVGLTAVNKYQPGTLLDVRYDPQAPAQVSIVGRHGVPSSNPEEQARQRHAREQAQRAETAANAAAVGSVASWQELARRTDPAALPPAAAVPAWGGPRPAGAVPVPVEFDPVTNLGPAAAVHEHQDQGISLVPHFGPPPPSVLVRYRDGLAYRTRGPDVHTWRWDETAAIQSNVSDHFSQHATFPWTKHEYTLTRPGGEKLILAGSPFDGLKDIEPLIAAVKAAVFALLAPPLAQRYQAGEALTFGPVTIQRQNGLKLDGKSYAWDAIQDIQVDGGLLKVTLRTGQKNEARVSALPNIELLCQLIGVPLPSPARLSHLA